MDELDVVDRLHADGAVRGDLVGLAVSGAAIGIATAAGEWYLRTEDVPSVLRRIESVVGPRWIWWSSDTARTLVGLGVRVARCWDIAAVHRLLFGGWQADPARVWAQLHDLVLDALPLVAEPNLFTYNDRVGDPEHPVRPDGYLRPEWVRGDWATAPERLGRWAGLAFASAALQQSRLQEIRDRPRALASARSESAAEFLCAELSADGLPMDRLAAESILHGIVGKRPQTDIEVAELRAQRDAAVLTHVPAAGQIDLRSPGQVRALLRNIGLDLPDTRAWRLRALRDTHPLVEALLTWRKAERVATTYGYSWLDEHLGEDGRLRGRWTGCDGAAGRMTASSGLHNMPAEMRPAVVAEQGYLFVRADLGQIEPRVLAAVSRDTVLAAAAEEDDMYAPVAEQLAVDRATAKVAVLGAMYGQTTGDGGRALRRLEATYPVAMAYLADADRSGQAGRDVRTYGGRLVQMRTADPATVGIREARSIAAAQGRYGRNALIQGAAAELFKAWAVTVRARVDAQIVLCLHDELLLHVPLGRADRTVQLVDDCLQEAVHNWAPDSSVRFLADIAIIKRWSNAKELENVVSDGV